MLLAASWTIISRSPPATKNQVMMTRSAAERRSCHIDRQRMTIVHFEPGLCGARPPMSAAARMPRCWHETCHTTVSAYEGTAAVWMLLKIVMT